MMNKIYFLSLVICAIIVFSCNKKINNPLEKDTGSSIKVNEEFSLKNKEVAILDNKELVIEVLEVMDGRCPVGVNCIRAGEVKFTLLLKSQTKELNTVLSYPVKGRNVKGSQVFEGYTIELTGASQKNDDKLDPANLAGIFMINKGETTPVK